MYTGSILYHCVHVFVCWFVLAIQQRKAMGRGRDMFRARKQNTSRPPSMHVDDFMNISHRVRHTHILN